MAIALLVPAVLTDMLTTTTPQLKRLSGWEALQQKYEDTDRQLEQFRLPGQDSMKESERRIGKVCTHTDLFRRIRSFNPDITMETSIADPRNAGFYLLSREGKRFVCAFPRGPLTEWSIVETDRADLPTKERRGWRTVLVRLLQSRCLTFNQVSEIVRDIYGYAPMEWNQLWYLNTKHFRTKE